MPNGIDLIEEQHHNVERLFARYSAEGDDSVAREIARELTVHAQLEEELLYPRLRGDAGATVERAEDEHAAVSNVIARLEQTPPADVRELMVELERLVARHVAEEERDLLPLARRTLDVHDLGRAIEARHSELLEAIS